MSIRKRREIFHNGIILIILVLSLVVQSFTSVYTFALRSSDSYIVHPPIVIVGNQNFLTQASTENWLGDGTPASPYTIEGLNITSPLDTSLIDIRNTDVFFHIANCLLDGGAYGIKLDNVTNGQISGNVINHNLGNGVQLDLGKATNISNIISDNRGRGIDVNFSDNSTITGNTVGNNGEHGIRMDDSRGSTIAGNTFRNNGGIGIVIGTSGKSTIVNNTIISNGADGISLEASEDSVITGNRVEDNRVGIRLSISDNSSIWGNVITINRISGLALDNSDDSTISGNNITFNRGYGIYLDDTDNTIVKWNYFISNNSTGASQAFDDGTNNIFDNNYWDEWIRPDNDQDGVVDRAYPIDGLASNQDGAPRASPKAASREGIPSHIIPALIVLMGILSFLGISVLIQGRKRSDR
ncbi:MAG: nitrous oxide reductase family maturation protein NosD [Candidatus Thorarchaeota archaeon]